jgi:hypothetical protein
MHVNSHYHLNTPRKYYEVYAIAAVSSTLSLGTLPFYTSFIAIAIATMPGYAIIIIRGVN